MPLNLNFVKSQEVLFCAEKTIDGANCQNVPQEECATGINPFTNQPHGCTPTSCESTSYCRLGTCVDTKEGDCQNNVAEIVCSEAGGNWYNQPKDELPQCSLGCCLAGDQAAFVTQTSCNAIASAYGITSQFRGDITDQATCISMATSDAKGACVFEREFVRTCDLTTKRECQDRQKSDSTAGFHEDILCSANFLATNCAPSQLTTCVLGEDPVYFKDTCGNIANVYDSTKINDVNYWTYIKEPSESCGFEDSNAGSNSCGNCDYSAGSICKNYKKTSSSSPDFGDFICADLSCDFEGNTYQHRESWCASSAIDSEYNSSPGAEDFKYACYNGEVTVELCNPWRQSSCVQTDVNEYSYAKCIPNLWKDCFLQDSKDDCINIEERDCKWIIGKSVLGDESGNERLFETETDEKVKASCVPNYPPGLNFWEDEETAAENDRTTDSQLQCSIGTHNCLITYDKPLLVGKKKLQEDVDKQRQYCIDNCECVPGYKPENKDSDFWESVKIILGARNEYPSCRSGCRSNDNFLSSFENICESSGDCGVKANYLGVSGKQKDYEDPTYGGLTKY